MKESDLRERIVQALTGEAGGFWFIAHGSLHQLTGLPDIIGCLPGGQFCAVEVKLPGKRNTATVRQRHVLSLLRHAGGLAGIATTIDEALEIAGVKNRSSAS